MTSRNFVIVTVVALIQISATCGNAASKDRVVTLYRNSAIDKNMRIHVATFDADEKQEYNYENCAVASGLFSKQPGVTVRYWCETGFYKRHSSY